MRAGEPLSIENQKLINTNYAKEQSWNIIDNEMGFKETNEFA